jgi:DNA processing protein
VKDPLTPQVGIALADHQRMAWLRLIRSENIGPITFVELIKRFGTASNALEALPDITRRSYGKSTTIASREQAEHEFAAIQAIGGQIVCLGEPGYPSALRAADAPPPVLTVLGSTSILSQNAIAFVGSRNASLAGMKLTRRLAADVTSSGYVTVSGLARGIDSAAHHASVKAGTVAVMAGGVDHIYPSENEALARTIVDSGGALISEMPLGWQPRARDFPRRNRIIAGMALGLVVVEAAHRSGSLISARLANEMGRLVFAVPGSPLDPRSQGTNHLIQQGAQLITNADDILQALDPITERPAQSPYSLDEDRNASRDMESPPDNNERVRLVDSLGHTPVHIDEILRHADMDPGKVQMVLLELDLAGKIERHAGNRISLV